jgi:hypothetical protein
VDFRPSCHRDTDEDDFGYPLRVPFGVSQPQGRTPGAAEYQPPVEAEVLSEVFNVPQQVSGCIDREVRVQIAGVRRASTAATLIEEDNSVGIRIEEAAGSGRTSGTRTTVKDDGRLALLITADLPVNAVPVADVEHAMVVRFDFRIEQHRVRRLVMLRVTASRLVDLHRLHSVTLSDRVHDVLPLHDLPEHGVLPVQVWLGRMRDEELTAVRVGPGVRHGDHSTLMP